MSGAQLTPHLELLNVAVKIFFSHNRDRNIQIVCIQWPDLCGTLREHRIDIKKCFELCRRRHQGLLINRGMVLSDIPAKTDDFPFGELHNQWAMVPCWDTLRVCELRPGHATIMGHLFQPFASDPCNKCPRRLLAKVVHEMEQVWKPNIKIGFEITFTLLNPASNKIQELAGRPNDDAVKLGGLPYAQDLIKELRIALEKQRIHVHHVHTHAHGRTRIGLSPASPLIAVDALIVAQHTIRFVCSKNGLKASMAPCPTGDKSVELCRTGFQLIMWNPQQHRLLQLALAGILRHSHSLCALGLASYDSYYLTKRSSYVKGDDFTTYFPVSLNRARHWELHMLDSTANVYLFTAAVLVAAKRGLEGKIISPMHWYGARFVPDLMAQGKRREYGLDLGMPNRQTVALDCLQKDTELNTLLGSTLINTYLWMKRLSLLTFRSMGAAKRMRCFLDHY